MIKEESFFIPSKIKIGFQKRSDTYTGKLAYIIYYDNLGVLRKEKSWEGWRDKKITPQEIENVPTEGFMLNRQAGGCKSDWNYRQAYCRIWDPRGFEFEITIDNLLWISDVKNLIRRLQMEDEIKKLDKAIQDLPKFYTSDKRDEIEFKKLLDSLN